MAAPPLAWVDSRWHCTARGPVHMIKLTATQEITPYKWVHPDEDC
jgi:hypothetical protein